MKAIIIFFRQLVFGCSFSSALLLFIVNNSGGVRQGSHNQYFMGSGISKITVSILLFPLLFLPEIAVSFCPIRTFT
jgi:hypothetical protein